MGWAAVAAVAGLFTAAVALFALGVAARQLGHLRKSTNAQLAADLHQRLFREETRATMRLVYNRRRDCLRYLPEADKASVDGVLNLLNMIGALLRNRTIDERLAVYTLGGAKALRCWYQLPLYISDEREARGRAYCADLEYFAKRVVQRQLRSDPVSEWIRLSSRPLIEEELKKPHLLRGCDVWKAKAVRCICVLIECITGCPREYEVMCAGHRQTVCFHHKFVKDDKRKCFRALDPQTLDLMQRCTLLSGCELSRALLCRTVKSIWKTELQWKTEAD